jgi:NADP-dependent 3-hydroxy acid dehydrogenase YdfG
VQQHLFPLSRRSVTEPGPNYVAGKVILVTGAGSGFGRLVATMTASLGAAVVAVDIDLAAAQETAAGIAGAGGRAEAVEADVTVKEHMDRVAESAVDRFGALDVLVNNAGVMPLAFFSDHKVAWEAWSRAIDINIKGVVNGITAVYDQMIEQGRGHIVNISSIYGNQGTAGSAVYSATKAAVVTLSDALRVEAQGKIKVTVVRPTGVPGTGLGAGVLNPDAIVGLTGQNAERFGQQYQAWMDGALRPERDRDDVRYWTLSPEDLAAQIVAVINTPWGVTISDITVRATGEDYIN